MKRSVNTIIIEPRTLLREGLFSLLHDSDFRVISTVATPDKVPHAALERASLLIIGVSNEPAEILDYVRKNFCTARNIKIAIVAEMSSRVSQSDVLKNLSNGVDCCIFNVRSRDVLLRSLHLAVLGQRVVVMGQDGGVPDIMEVAIKPTSSIEYDPRAIGECVAQLSARELEILSFVVAGNSNKAIARTCQLAESTVKIHLKTILRKIRVRNRTQAAIWAIQNASGGGISLPPESIMIDGGIKHSLQGREL